MQISNHLNTLKNLITIPSSDCDCDWGNLQFTKLLQRESEYNKIKCLLNQFDNKNLTTKKGIYIYGEPGIGKTQFVIDILKELNYDIIKYDAGDIRNKNIIDTITKHNMSNKNIMSLFNNKIKKIVILMDEIDGMNNGDKSGINSLIKLIRPKKTKKQKKDEISLSPIICIGNYHFNKKMKELMKVCNTIELKKPSVLQINNILQILIPNVSEELKMVMTEYIYGDLRKLKGIYQIYNMYEDKELFNKILLNLLQSKSYNDDTKKITQKLINNPYSINDHLNIMNETDRTIIGLLWHENIIDALDKMDKSKSIPFYIDILNNMCFADYIDRITFQKQIWQFNEMSSLIKTFKNNKIYHETFSNKKLINDVRFTKVLTKYSTEYNNSTFIQNLCQQLNMDKKDLFGFFIDIQNKYSDIDRLELFENYDISKLDINRIYRYLEKYTTEVEVDTNEDEDDESLYLNDEVN
jgi:SpoVK/Ycf46/Vps4 family AAA+-type ATPase